MTEDIKSIRCIEGQPLRFNARNISMQWIAMRKTPMYEEISESCITWLYHSRNTSVKRNRTLDTHKLHTEYFKINNFMTEQKLQKNKK